MKLLVVTPYFYPKIGGLEKYAYNFCMAIKKKYKWDIVVITSNHSNNIDKIETIDGLKIYRLAPLFKFSNTPINPLWYWKIKKILNIEKPDFINAHTPVPFIADMAALAARKTPFFVTYHAFSLYKHNSTSFNVLIKIYKLLENILFAKSDKIILASYVIEETISRKFRHKVEILNNSISKNNIPSFRKIKEFESEALVFIGSLDKSHDWKGLNEILLAIKLYRKITKKVIHLYVIGDGNNKDEYKKLAKKYGILKYVTFFGKKEGKSKDEILRKATLGVIYPKSSNDAFPTVLLEYWSYSLPVLASNIIPINKIIKNKSTAYLVEPKNIKALTDAIIDLSSNKELTKKISKGGYNELKTKYILEKEIEKFYLITKGYSL